MLFPIIVIAIFAICFIIYFYKQSQIKKYGITTEATVTRIHFQERYEADGVDHTTVYVKYDDENGQQCIAEHSVLRDLSRKALDPVSPNQFDD